MWGNTEHRISLRIMGQNLLWTLRPQTAVPPSLLPHFLSPPIQSPLHMLFFLPIILSPPSSFHVIDVLLSFLIRKATEKEEAPSQMLQVESSLIAFSALQKLLLVPLFHGLITICERRLSCSIAAAAAIIIVFPDRFPFLFSIIVVVIVAIDESTEASNNWSSITSQKRK